MEQVSMQDAIKVAESLNQKYSGKIARHNKKGNYYVILGIRPFCCSSIPELEGKLVVEYARNGEVFTRFLDEFFAVVPNLQQQRFEIVPEKDGI
jgi:hypothetical protein